MAKLFSLLLNMSWTGSVVILVVLVIRFFLRRAPKSISYALWSVVLFRLLCPVSLSVEHAPLAAVRPSLRALSPMTSLLTPLPAPKLTIQSTGPTVQPLPAVQTRNPMDILAWVWLVGVLLFLGAILVSVLRTHWKLRDSIRLEDHVYWTDRIEVPFSFWRNIYLPAGLEPEQRTCVLLHERHHIRRGDPLWKLLGLLALSLHWLNPLCWLAFHLAERDMEMSCDEAVLNTLDHDGRVEYSTLLLELASGQKLRGAALPFAGESPEKRIRNILHWKRPATGVLLACAVIATMVVVLLAVNPGGTPEASEDEQSEDSFLSLLRTGEIVSAEGKNLPPLNVVESLFHEVFRNPSLEDDVQVDQVWKMTAELQFPEDSDTERITLQCGLEYPDMVQLSGDTRFPDTILVQSRSLYELVQSARNPALSDDRIPYIDDPEAYGRYHPIVDAFLSRDLGTNGIHTHSTLTHFLAVRTVEHPLGAKVYYVGSYTVADPILRTSELLSGKAYVDSQSRIYDLEPCQSLVTVDDVPIGFVSEDWLRGNDLNYESQQALIDAVLEQGLPVESLIS